MAQKQNLIPTERVELIRSIMGGSPIPTPVSRPVPDPAPIRPQPQAESTGLLGMGILPEKEEIISMGRGVLNRLGLLDEARDAEQFIQSLFHDKSSVTPVLQDTEFMEALSEYAKESNTPIENLLAVMSLETKNTFDPSIRAKNSSATGLVQILEATAKEFGTSTDDLRKMSRIEQLPFAVKIFNRNRGNTKTPRSLVDTYLSVFAPAHIDKSMDYKIYKKGGRRYAANPSLDPDKEGYISKRTIQKALLPYIEKVNRMLGNKNGQ